MLRVFVMNGESGHDPCNQQEPVESTTTDSALGEACRKASVTLAISYHRARGMA